MPWPPGRTSAPPRRERRGCSTQRSCPCRFRSARASRSSSRPTRHPSETTVEILGKLRAAFAEGGSITAGNASPISDGASAVVLTTRPSPRSAAGRSLATVGASGQVAGPPDNALHSSPAHAIARALEKQGIAASDLESRRINEAFGAVVGAVAGRLGLSDDVVNPHGGGTRSGHPIGASGNRLVVHAVHELVRRGSGTAAVALCAGGGQGDALILTR